MFQTDPECTDDTAAELEETRSESRRRLAAPPAGGRRGAGRVRGAAPAPAAAAAMPILVKAAAGAGTRHASRSLRARSAAAFASGAHRAAATVSPEPCLCYPKLWPAPPRLGTRDQPGKEQEAQLPPAAPTGPAICSLALPELNREAKVGSWLRWEQLWQPRRLLAACSPRPGRRLLAGRAVSGFPVFGSHLSPTVWAPKPQTVKCQLLQLGAGSASVPGCSGPIECQFPRSASGKPLKSSASPLRAGLLGLAAPEPTTASPRLL